MELCFLEEHFHIYTPTFFQDKFDALTPLDIEMYYIQLYTIVYTLYTMQFPLKGNCIVFRKNCSQMKLLYFVN